MSGLLRLLSANPGASALVAVLGLSVGLNVYLGERLRAVPVNRTVRQIASGSRLPDPLLVLSVAGKPASLRFGPGSATVVYVFSPVCIWCHRNEHAIKALVAQASGRYRFVGLSLVSAGLKKYVAAGHAPFPAYAVRNEKQALKLGLVVTPETLVVGAGGKVLDAWPGAYIGENHTKVADFFRAKLPAVPTGEPVAKPAA